MSMTPNTVTQKPPAPVDDDDQLERDLLTDGILDQVPGSTDATAYRQWQPIPWDGKPASETILEERR